MSRSGDLERGWHDHRSGYCQCDCGLFGMNLVHLHVVDLETIRGQGREDLLWDWRNGMFVRPVCSLRHTDAFRRIPFASVPDSALDFAVDLLGEGAAAAYFAGQYAGDERRAA